MPLTTDHKPINEAETHAEHTDHTLKATEQFLTSLFGIRPELFRSEGKLRKT